MLLKAESERPAPRQGAGQSPLPSDGAKVEIKGWVTGFEKVAFTQFLRSYCGYRLADAKSMTDQILQGRTVKRELSSTLSPTNVAEEVRRLGAQVQSVAPASKALLYHVMPRTGSWVIKRMDTKRVTRVFDSKAEAVSYAKQIAEKSPAGKFIVHNRDGSQSSRSD